MLKWVLFETKLGELLLTLLERRTGLAVVEASSLGEQQAPWPADSTEEEPRPLERERTAA